ncbi:hypothetical protein [Klebsiella pneumoniae]|uniref:hypothetical protein n=1 Tax=Klebsiella pneumoniae TaxID=573 RepID=UPI003F5CB0CF
MSPNWPLNCTANLLQEEHYANSRSKSTSRRRTSLRNTSPEIAEAIFEVEEELAIARYQGEHVAKLAVKLHG